MLIAGVDIGNSTTEVCIGEVNKNEIIFLTSGEATTTGTKGTPINVKGIKVALNKALKKIGKEVSDLELIRINEAAPVIGDTAMETITETIITESAMLGHDPSTPAGKGFAIGTSILLNDLIKAKNDQPYVVVISKEFDYEEAANIINNSNINIVGAIVQKDEAVLIYNRINKKIPIIDEVREIEKIPLNMLTAIEVAPIGKTINKLSNPFGIASLFNLTSEQTKHVIPIAKSLIGNRSAVVIRTPKGAVKERIIPAGDLTIIYNGNQVIRIGVDQGAESIMKAVESVKNIEDIKGESGTNIGSMINRMKESLASLTGQDIKNLTIKDILAIDTFVPSNVKGALAGEISMENAVAIAAMVKANKLPMNKIAGLLQYQLKVPVEVAGVEAVMATLGALTTKGSTLPIAILDLGGGSTDAAILDKKGIIKSIHLAGAGSFITMMIDKELGLSNRMIAEEIKKYPLGKVDSLFSLRMENGEVIFYKEPLDPKFYGKVVIVKENELVPIESNHTLEKIVEIRIRIKKEVFVKNALRALQKIAPDNNIRLIPNVIMVGGSALDFEIPDLILKELAPYNITTGRGEIRGVCGPRNAVATGLVMSYKGGS